MNIDLELYKVFYTVAKNKHMTKSSEELHISQPAISQSIKKLEEPKDIYEKYIIQRALFKFDCFIDLD